MKQLPVYSDEKDNTIAKSKLNINKGWMGSEKYLKRPSCSFSQSSNPRQQGRLRREFATIRSTQLFQSVPCGPIPLCWQRCSEYWRANAQNNVQTSEATQPIISPLKISRYPIINPPNTMQPIHPQWILLKLLGRLIAIPTTRTKNTTNFLKAMKAANGIMVTQQLESMLIVHIMNAQGMMQTSYFSSIKVRRPIRLLMPMITIL